MRDTKIWLTNIYIFSKCEFCYIQSAGRNSPCLVEDHRGYLAGNFEVGDVFYQHAQTSGGRNRRYHCRRRGQNQGTWTGDNKYGDCIVNISCEKQHDSSNH